MARRKLPERLQAVADFVTTRSLVDVGTDHGLLPRYLIDEKIVDRVIAIEKNSVPLENCRRALRGRNADIRFGDGLAVYDRGECETLSLCGLGHRTIVSVLSKWRDRLPDQIVVQPNDSPESIRRWAFQNEYQLADERMVRGFWRYTILRLERTAVKDPIYAGEIEDIQFRFGPRLLSRGCPILLDELEHLRTSFEYLIRNAAPRESELRFVERAIDVWQPARDGDCPQIEM
jgi:tRNA (adenine22-N1)-methyltransferase